MKILFVDACPRDESRTRVLAEALLGRLEGEITHLRLNDCDMATLDNDAIIKRGADCDAGNFDGSYYIYAKEFAAADIIVIAAPYWDLSFPAVLKKYIETVSVTGITFTYSDEGAPVGLCKAEKLFYVTTAGGPIFSDEFGYGYIRAMAQGMYGIGNCQQFKAENLDIYGNDVQAILNETLEEIRTTEL